MPKLNVTPSKHIYDALIQDIDVNQAISDLIDNAIDNWKIEGHGGKLLIYIEMNHNVIKIKDVSGGLDENTLPFILMPGGRREVSREGIKGIWGVGSKRALFSLGKKITISTRKQGGKGLVLKVDENWFRADEGDDKWTIGYEEDNSLEEGITIIEITELKVPLYPQYISSLRKHIARTYHDDIKDGTVEISFNGEAITIYPEIPWAKSEYAPPARYVTDIPVSGNGRVLNFEMTTGVMLKPGEAYSYGIDFIGNKRVILQNNLDARMGFDADNLGFPHPTINRFKAIVRVNGDSRDIPWNSAKSDINTNHPMYVPIVDLVVQVSRQYTSFLRKNYEVTSKLFRNLAEQSDIEDVSFEYGKEFRRVVKDFEEEEKLITIRFAVPQEEYTELVQGFGLGKSTKTQVGLFIFDKALKELRGIVED
jgi:hypothetical protein